MYRALGIRATVVPFLYDMPAVLQTADLVVARAGAMTIAELTACGKAAILIPLGFFLSVAFTPDRPNEWIWSLYAGALMLAISVVVLGVGLIRA